MTDNTIPRAAIDATTLEGEPATDKAFKSLEDGHCYRVRIVPRDTDASGASLYTRAYTITITRLTDDKSVERNSDGSIDIVASDTVTIDQESWTNGNTPADTFNRIIEQMIHRAGETSRVKNDLDSYMEGWGVPIGSAS